MIISPLESSLSSKPLSHQLHTYNSKRLVFFSTVPRPLRRRVLEALISTPVDRKIFPLSPLLATNLS